MKKLFVLMAVVLLVAGCNKKVDVQKDLTGTWTAYKYLLYNADQTQLFTDHFGTYTITFNGKGQYIRTVTVPDSTTASGNYYIQNGNEQLVLADTTYTYNTIDSVYVPVVNQEQYNLFNLTSVNVELITDSSTIYMDKKQ